MAADHGERTARRIRLIGAVQGLGVRPFLYRLAMESGVAGWVENGPSGVVVHVEGLLEGVEQFLKRTPCELPIGARIDRLESVEATFEGIAGFEIRPSRTQGPPTAWISPDLPVCDECLREIRDPADRRYRYPYINCTRCGPRYSLLLRLPYDRCNTTMADWRMCEACRAEYENPDDRRFHAQPTSCAQCGPTYRWIVDGECKASGDDAVASASRALCEGKIVAVKGIGGYHLACDANCSAAVQALRRRKFRKEQPFALLARDPAAARFAVDLSTAHENLLWDSARPIVLAPAKGNWPDVAPDRRSLGIMLPHSPLQHVLFERGAPPLLVMTSGNRSSEPIAFRDDDALQRLSGIADGFLVGRRLIARRVDDSVVAVRRGGPMVLRRSRGWAPAPVASLPTTQPILAVGGDLKNSVAIVVEGRVFVSQHLGDLDDDDSRTSFESTVEDLLSMYEVNLSELIVACDLHPQYRSTKFAETLGCRERIGVQHHRAHAASVLAEHGLLDESAICVALDGTGYGDDGCIWGGEFFVGSIRQGFERVASLRPFSLVGGDAASRFPVQAAAGFLAEIADPPNMFAEPFGFPSRFSGAIAAAKANVRCFPCTSIGRLFDAAAALVGFRREATYEGQAPAWLEMQATRVQPQQAYPFPAGDWRPLLRAIVADRLQGRSHGEIAYAFHAAVAAWIVEQVQSIRRERKIDVVALSGGVFQNELLLDLVCEGLESSESANASGRPLRVLTNRLVPVNDGGLCLGQAALAACSTTIPLP